MAGIPFTYLPTWTFIGNMAVKFKMDYMDIFRFSLIPTQLLKASNLTGTLTLLSINIFR